MNNTKRVLVALALSGAVLSMSGAAHAAAATANSPSRAVPVDGILGINLNHILHGLGLGVGGQLLGNARGENHARGHFLPAGHSVVAPLPMSGGLL
ncbi:hypothetical protein CP980_00365 [Streptomyces vinaceus]|uniref:Chaplin n=1 Tax=Streptomyces vinaceus TaxID=1960 RepID=A0A5J6J2B3_STRVI|nr:hypothetical protein [Streptomyces vinaceus]QEV43741.1 hypothetical protein CP980_00365 [Streptomyces vinaceus]GHE56412.1 hypothetical protein GCM10017778_45810 [Streptomyces vinaceus]